MSDLMESLTESCLFCYPGEQKKQIIGYTPNFYIFVGLGQIIKGYVLIVSRTHTDCIAALSGKQQEELEHVQDIVRQMYLDKYGNASLFFEHGRIGSCMNMSGTRHCYHAHLHCTPAPNDSEGNPIDLLPEIDILPKKVTSFSEIVEKSDGCPYLYYENSKEEKYLFGLTSRPIESQFLRRKLAKARNLPEAIADWKENPTWETVYNIRDQLSIWLAKNHTGHILANDSSSLISKEVDFQQPISNISLPRGENGGNKVVNEL